MLCGFETEKIGKFELTFYTGDSSGTDKKLKTSSLENFKLVQFLFRKSSSRKEIKRFKKKSFCY